MNLSLSSTEINVSFQILLQKLTILKPMEIDLTIELHVGKGK
jgi:hypothetical protein